MFSKDEVKQFLANFITNLTSVKFFIIIMACIFLYIGKLSEGLWQETVLVVAGLRVATDVASMFKKPGEAPVEQQNQDSGKT